ncbi:dihydropteridine reductase-like isoform X1 [Varroa jacobsoni]|uniref:dihydropteridine reductase-like isoform X1 n=2 Tax=Varroa jacobsoni TaxID=62625 RepID=UPI000BF434D7|nr:dihydropteridine reductase-like isoform X1 [Varroa jacobsoni]
MENESALSFLAEPGIAKWRMKLPRSLERVRLPKPCPRSAATGIHPPVSQTQKMAGRVVIYGGKGALGSVCTHTFKSKNFWVCSIDGSVNDTANENIVVDFTKDLQSQHEQISSELTTKLGGEKLDAVICVAGGWAGGNATNKEFIKNSDLMLKQSVWTSLIAASLSAKHLKQGGVCALTGAQASLSATPGMIGYGMAKAAVHHLVSSLAAPKSGLPDGATCVAILPVTLDTPMNRKWMPKADTSTWTPLEFVADLFVGWASDTAKRPASGSLVQLVTKEGKTELVI